MAIKKRNFQRGVVLRPDDVALEGIEGELKVGETSGKLEAHLEGADREVTTNDQTQTLENKTIDGTAATGNNTVTADADNISYDPTLSGLAATDVKAAIDELQTGLENQNEASEISYDNTTSGLTATNVQGAIDEVEGRVDTIEGATYVNSFNGRTGAVSPATSDYDAVQVDYDNSTSGLTATDTQAAIDEVEGRLDTAETNISTNTTDIGTNNTLITDHIADTVDAHDASAISNVPAGNLEATDVQSALNELQTDVDTRALDSDLTAHLNDAVDAHDASAISSVPSGNLAATDVQTALDELQTDIDTRATDADLTAHTGATSGVHGVTGDVVGTTDAQTLTNKTITGADIRTPTRLDVKQDTKANLDTYATTASNGQIVFATDNKKMYQVVDAALVELGAGAGGAGSPYTYFVETFEDNSAANFSVAGAAVVSNQTVNPLYDDRSIQIRHSSGDGVSDILLDIAIPIQQGQKEVLNAVRVGVYSPTANADATYRLRVIESPDDVTYADVDSFLDFKATNKTEVIQLNFYPKSTSEFLKFQIEIIDDTTLALEDLFIDNIEFLTNPLPIVEFLKDSYDVALESTSGASLTANVTDIPYNVENQNLGDVWDGSGFTFPEDRVVTLQGQVRFTVASQATIAIYADGVTKYQYQAPPASAEIHPFGFTFLAEAGVRYSLRPNVSRTMTALGRDNLLGFTTAPVRSSGVVTEGQSSNNALVNANTSGSQVHNNSGNWQIIPLNNESYDNKGIYNNSTYELTLDKSAVWTIKAGVSFTASSGGTLGVRLVIDGTPNRRDERDDSNASVTADPKVSITRYLEEGTVISVQAIQSSGGSLTYRDLDTYLEAYENSVDNVSVISPFKTEITTGQEYKTGEIIDGKPVYEYVYKVPSDITSSATLTTLDSGLNPIGAINYSTTVWALYNVTFNGTNTVLVEYNSSGGTLSVAINGASYKLGTGTIIRFKYTK